MEFLKMIKKLSYQFLCALLLITIFLLAQSNAKELKGLKKRIAVFNFEDKTDHRTRWWTGQPVGHGMADMLVTALIETGKYQVIERTELDNIMKEQGLGQSGLVTQESAAKVGKLLGVELAVMGAVTEFGHSKGGVGGRIKGFGLGVKKLSATVGIDVRFVDTTTGEILDAKSTRAEKTSHGLKVSTPKVDFNNRKDFDESLVGKACREAIEKLKSEIDTQINKLSWQGKVVKASGNSVIINAGAEAGVEVGMEFVVYSPGEELFDPDTGISLGSEETRLGRIRVTKNTIGNGRASNCVVIEGSGFSRGDYVREK
jgi:curli biogenesis system outer membrane secretion channel CsgG